MEKKKLDYYMSLDYELIIKKCKKEDGGGYIVTCPDLVGFLTGGDTLEEVQNNIVESKRTYFDAFEDNEEIPLPGSCELKFNGKILIRTPKSLHKELVELSEKENISLNQYILYLLSKGVSTLAKIS